MTNYVLLSLVVHLLGKHKDYTSLPAEDKSWTVSAATQAMYRLEQMKPLLIKQHTTRYQQNMSHAGAHQTDHESLAARLAALRTAPASNASASPAGGGQMSHFPAETPAAQSAGAAIHESLDSSSVESAEVVPPPKAAVTHGATSVDYSTPGPQAQVAGRTSWMAPHNADPVPLRNVSSPSQLQQFAPMVGIQNPGSMCYISASIAVLLRCESMHGHRLHTSLPVAPPSSAPVSVLHALASQAGALQSACGAGASAAELSPAVCAALQRAGLHNTVGEEGDAQEALGVILGAAQEQQWPGGGDFKLTTQVIWRKADGSTKLLQPESANMLHVPIPRRYLLSKSAAAVPLEHCLAEALEPPPPGRRGGARRVWGALHDSSDWMSPHACAAHPPRGKHHGSAGSWVQPARRHACQRSRRGVSG